MITGAHKWTAGHLSKTKRTRQSRQLVEFGGLEKAIEIARDLAGLPAGKDVKRVVFPAPRPFLETLLNPEESMLFGRSKTEQAVADSLPADVRKAFRYTSLFERMGSGDAMLMMPFELRIR